MKGLLLCVLALSASQPLLALDKVGITVGAGITVPTGEHSYYEEETGGHFAGSVDGPALLSGLHVRLDVLFSKTRQTQFVGGTVGFLYFPLSAGTIKPYLIAGGGLYDVGVSDLSISSNPVFPAPPPSHMTRHEIKPGVAVGGGASIELGGLQLFVEGRYVEVFTDMDIFVLRDDRIFRDHRPSSCVPVTIGVRFGGRR